MSAVSTYACRRSLIRKSYRYDPNVFTLNLEQLLSGTPLDSAIGVLKVHVESARGLKATKIGGGAPDPYISLSLGGKPSLVKTKTIHDTHNPTWNESQFLLVNTLADVLNLAIFDYNDRRADSHLGTITHDLSELAKDAELESSSKKVLVDGKDRGEVNYSLSYYPVLTPTKLPDGTLEPVPESITGIVRLTIHQAKDFQASGHLNPYAKVYLGKGQQIHRTQTIKSSSAPIWESHIEFLVPDKGNSTVTIRVIDDKEMARNPDLGTVTIRLTDLLEARERKQDWFPFAGGRSGKIRLTTEWKPLAIAGGISGASAYVQPIGIMRIWLKKAVDVKNVESKMGGKSDPYVRVLLNNKVMARTEVINNNLDPEWDSIVYVPVHRLGERLLLEVMDYQNLTKDRSLGTVELKVSDYVVKGDPSDSEPYVSTGSQDRFEHIQLGRGQGTKGTLHYTASFSPAIALKGGIAFAPVGNDLDFAIEERHGNTRRSSFDSVRSRASFKRSHRSRASMDNSMKSIRTANSAEPLSARTAMSRPDTPATEIDDEAAQPGVELSDEELFSRRE